MGISHLLESFESSAATSEPVVAISEDRLEEQKLTAFESGYNAGWDDAIKSKEDDANRITHDLEKNLQQISFSYHEAHTMILNSLKPFLQEVVGKILPEIALSNFSSYLMLQFEKAAAGAMAHEAEIIVCPDNIEPLSRILEHEKFRNVSLKADPMLGEGQAYLRYQQSELQVDLDGVLAEIRGSIEGFFQKPEPESTKGIEHG